MFLINLSLSGWENFCVAIPELYADISFSLFALSLTLTFSSNNGSDSFVICCVLLLFIAFWSMTSISSSSSKLSLIIIGSLLFYWVQRLIISCLGLRASFLGIVQRGLFDLVEHLFVNFTVICIGDVQVWTWIWIHFHIVLLTINALCRLHYWFYIRIWFMQNYRFNLFFANQVIIWVVSS